MNTILNDRILWHDGKSEVLIAQLPKMCVKYNLLPTDFILRDDDEVTSFNENFPLNKIQTATTNALVLDTTFNMQGDGFVLSDYVMNVFLSMHTKGLTSLEIRDRYDRLEMELQLFEQHNLIEYITSVFHLTLQMNSNGVVWAGRGSSCASYTLYILGIHNIDSVKYDLSITEFIR